MYSYNKTTVNYMEHRPSLTIFYYYYISDGPKEGYTPISAQKNDQLSIVILIFSYFYIVNIIIVAFIT